MGIDESPWLILGTPFRCLGVPPEAKPDLEALMQGFPRREPSSPEEVVELPASRKTSWTPRYLSAPRSNTA